MILSPNIVQIRPTVILNQITTYSEKHPNKFPEMAQLKREKYSENGRK